MKKNLYLMAMTIMVLNFTACTDSDDYVVENDVVVTDDKPFPYYQYMDTSVRPGDDFYRYQYGKWLDDSQLQSMATILSTKLQGIEAEVLKTSNDPVIAGVRQLAKASDADDSADMTLLKERIDYLASITTQEQLLAAFKQLHEWGYSPVVRLVPLGNARVIEPQFTSELPSVLVNEAFNSEKEENLSQPLQLICSKLSNFGFNDERIAEIGANALAVEKIEMKAYDNGFNRIIHPWTATTRTMTRGSSDVYVQVCQLMGIGDMADKVSESYEQEKGEAIEQLLNLLFEGSENSVAMMRDYMIEYVMGLDMMFIPRLMSPLPASYCMQFAMQYAKYHMFHLLVDALGTQNINKDRCAEIMEEFRSILRERIDNLDWMSDATKQAARKKLDNMSFLIGYPDKWHEEMTPVIDGTTLLNVVCNLRKQQAAAFRNLIGKSVDTHGWDSWYSFMSFTTVNASYNKTNNQLLIPPVFLIAPIFDLTQSEATLYGTASVFGHEMCHGFDAGGSEYDEMGYKRDWWTAEDKAAFKAKQQQLINLWNQLEQYPGQPADGVKTLRENMADYGGAMLAFEAYSRRLRQQGFTGEQYDEQLKKYWLSYGMPIAVIENERSVEMLKLQLLIDTHSAGHNRVNGIARLFDEWYRLYDVKPTDKLYLAPEERVKIW